MLNFYQKDVLTKICTGDALTTQESDIAYDILSDVCDNFIDFAYHHQECLSLSPYADSNDPPECDCGFDSALSYIMSISEVING